MGRYAPTYEDRLKREIRDAIALDPIATIRELTERLSKRLDHSFDPSYIKKLRDKVSRQLIIESDRESIADRMNKTRQNYRISREALLEIISSDALARDRVEAAKALVMLDLAVFKAEIETGMHKGPVEVLARQIHYEPVPVEVRTVIIAAWRRGGRQKQPSTRWCRNSNNLNLEPLCASGAGLLHRHQLRDYRVTDYSERCGFLGKRPNTAKEESRYRRRILAGEGSNLVLAGGGSNSVGEWYARRVIMIESYFRLYWKNQFARAIIGTLVSSVLYDHFNTYGCIPRQFGRSGECKCRGPRGSQIAGG
jgi:hypothetical protein